MTRRAVFLDRDGVLNRPVVRNGRPYPPRNVQELELLPGVVEALASLRKAGLLLFVVTNQPDVARGLVSRATVDAIHARLSAELDLDRIYVCMHDDADACDCRKPLPGLLHAAEREFDVSLPSSFMVGDRWRDVEAGRKAHCRTIFIDYGYDEKYPEPPPDHVCGSLAGAAQWILAQPC